MWVRFIMYNFCECITLSIVITQKLGVSGKFHLYDPCRQELLPVVFGWTAFGYNNNIAKHVLPVKLSRQDRRKSIKWKRLVPIPCRMRHTILRMPSCHAHLYLQSMDEPSWITKISLHVYVGGGIFMRFLYNGFYGRKKAETLPSGLFNDTGDIAVVVLFSDMVALKLRESGLLGLKFKKQYCFFIFL